MLPKIDGIPAGSQALDLKLSVSRLIAYMEI